MNNNDSKAAACCGSGAVSSSIKQNIVVENRAYTFTICDSRTEGLAEIYKERFIRLQVSVADNPHIKGASYCPRLKDNY